MQEPSWRSADIFACTTSLVLSVLSLIVIVVFVSRRCERIFMTDFGQADCGVGIGWFGLGGAFVVMALYCGYRLYGLVSEGE